MAYHSQIRAFIAVELPSEVKDALKSAQDVLRVTGADVRWVRPEGIHLTLKFLGDIEPDMADELAGALEGALKGRDTVRLNMEGAGTFGNPKAPRVVWAGLGGDMDSLAEIQRIVEDVCEGFGFEREQRPFKPHLTLGRVKSRRGVKNLMDTLDKAGQLLDAEFAADRVCLMRSELKPSGAVYTELAQICLG